MNRAAILSILPIYATAILDGTKTVELRKSSKGLRSGDVVLMYVTAPDKCFSFWWRIANVEELSVEEMWRRHQSRICIDHDAYLSYFSACTRAFGLHVGELRKVAPIQLEEVQMLVPEFAAPQGMIWLSGKSAKYDRLLSHLSEPLPEDVFPQQRLFESPMRGSS